MGNCRQRLSTCRACPRLCHLDLNACSSLNPEQQREGKFCTPGGRTRISLVSTNLPVRFFNLGGTFSEVTSQVVWLVVKGSGCLDDACKGPRNYFIHLLLYVVRYATWCSTCLCKNTKAGIDISAIRSGYAWTCSSFNRGNSKREELPKQVIPEKIGTCYSWKLGVMHACFHTIHHVELSSLH